MTDIFSSASFGNFQLKSRSLKTILNTQLTTSTGSCGIYGLHGFLKALLRFSRWEMADTLFYLLHCISGSVVCQLSMNRWLIQLHHPFFIFFGGGRFCLSCFFCRFLHWDILHISVPILSCFPFIFPRQFPFPPTNRWILINPTVWVLLTAQIKRGSTIPEPVRLTPFLAGTILCQEYALWANFRVSRGILYWSSIYR